MAEADDDIIEGKAEAELPAVRGEMRGEVKDFHFPPVLNGLDFLGSAVKSLSGEAGAPQPRDLKYAVLHLQAAAETLFKARLEMKHPSLVWSRPKEFDQAKHEAGRFTSCKLREALKRLRDNVDIETGIDPNDADLDALASLRNRLQHFEAKDTTIAVQARTVPVLDLLLKFIDTDLLPHDKSPEARDAQLQMDDIRADFRHLKDFVDHRLEALQEILETFKDCMVRCLSCGQFAVMLDDAKTVHCALCGRRYGSGSDAAWEYAGTSYYSVVTDGGGTPVHDCSECGTTAVFATPVASSDDADVLICFADGNSFDGICQYCDQAANFALEEARMCQHCLDTRFAKF
jgi:hypothetical protein